VRFKSPKKSSKFCLSERIAAESQRRIITARDEKPPAELFARASKPGYFVMNFNESSTLCTSADIGASIGTTA
jgi:hypothetical protein